MNKFISKIVGIKNVEYFVLFFLLLTGFLVRLYRVSAPIADWHSFRQVDTASVTRYFTSGEGSFLYPKYHDISRVQSGLDNPNGYRFVEFPVYNFLTASFYKVFKTFDLEVWGRLVSIFSALLTSVLIFLLGRRYISVVGGLLGTLFYLFIPYNIYFTRVILPEPLAVLLGVSSIFYFVNFLDKEKQINLFLSGLFMALAVLVKPYMIFYGVPILLLAIQKYSFKKIIGDTRFIVFFALSLLPFFLWRLWIGRYPEGIPFYKWTLNGDGIRFKPAFWYWIFGERLTKLILGYLGIIPFAIGFMATETKKNFIHFFALGMFLYVSIIATANVKRDYYQVLVIPAVSLMLSWGSIKLWNSESLNKTIRRVVVVFSLLMMFIAGWIQVREYYKINHPEIIEAGLALDAVAPKDALVIAAYNGDTAFLYQTKRKGWPVVELPIDELIAKGARYYLSVNLNDKQTLEFMERFEIVKKTDSFVILKLI